VVKVMSTEAAIRFGRPYWAEMTQRPGESIHEPGRGQPNIHGDKATEIRHNWEDDLAKGIRKPEPGGGAYGPEIGDWVKKNAQSKADWDQGQEEEKPEWGAKTDWRGAGANKPPKPAPMPTPKAIPQWWKHRIGTQNKFNDYYYGRGYDFYIITVKGENGPKGKMALQVSPSGQKTLYDKTDSPVNDIEGTLGEIGLSNLL
jgi:hypothetical protein